MSIQARFLESYNLKNNCPLYQPCFMVFMFVSFAIKLKMGNKNKLYFVGEIIFSGNMIYMGKKSNIILQNFSVK